MWTSDPDDADGIIWKAQAGMMVAGRRIAFRGMFLMLAACSSTRIHGTPPDAYEDHPPDASVDGADEDTPREDMACPSLCSRYDPVHATTIQSPFVSLQILEDRILLIDLDCRPADRNCTTRLEVLDYSGTIETDRLLLTWYSHKTKASSSDPVEYRFAAAPD